MIIQTSVTETVLIKIILQRNFHIKYRSINGFHISNEEKYSLKPNQDHQPSKITSDKNLENFAMHRNHQQTISKISQLTCTF